MAVLGTLLSSFVGTAPVAAQSATSTPAASATAAARAATAATTATATSTAAPTRDAHLAGSSPPDATVASDYGRHQRGRAGVGRDLDQHRLGLADKPAGLGVAATWFLHRRFVRPGERRAARQLVATAGPASTIIDGQNAAIVFQTDSGTVTVKGLTIQHGKAPVDQQTGKLRAGGGIYNYGATLTISGSVISGNQAGSGAGIDNDAGGPWGGGGSLTLDHTTISGNTVNGASNDGAGIENEGVLTITNSTIGCPPVNPPSGCANVASGSAWGGGIANWGTLSISNSSVSGNSAADGGGIYSDYGATIAQIDDSVLSGNVATTYSGGGIENYGAIGSITNSIVGCPPTAIASACANTANSGGGGGIYNGPAAAAGSWGNGQPSSSLPPATLAISGGNISGNRAEWGAGIYNRGTITQLSGSVVSGNSATTYDGGGIENDGTLTITNTSIGCPSWVTLPAACSNSANPSSFDGLGGGVANYGTMFISGGRISGNSAYRGGGLSSDGGSGTASL